jgi:hypothetical protein
MVAHGGLADTDLVSDVADAGRTLRARAQQRKDLQTSRIGDGLEQ